MKVGVFLQKQCELFRVKITADERMREKSAIIALGKKNEVERK